MWKSKGHILSICLGVFLLAIACSKVPKGILSEKEMQQVQTDMMMVDALIGINYNQYSNDTAKVALYESVFRKHDITQAIYDSSLVWYGKNLDIYMKVYERISADLSKRLLDLGDVQADAAPTSNADSVNIWPRRRSLVFSPASVFNGVIFDIKPDRNYPSGSTFTLGMNVWGLKPGMKHYPEIRISAVQRDTVIHITEKITEDGYFETELRTSPTRQVRRVYGSIWMDNADADYTRVYVDSINLYRYNYRTDFQSKEAAPEN